MTISSPSAWDPQGTKQLLLSRRTVHDFLEEPIAQDLIDDALDVALAAPNHRMTEPWRFVVVGPVTRAQLCEVAVDVKRRKGNLTERGENEIRRKFMEPPVLLVACRVRSERPDVEREDYAAIACALQNMMLMLWAHGVGSKWSTGAVTTDAATVALLGVPEAEEVVGFFWAGRARTAIDKPRRKLTRTEVVRLTP